MVENPQPPYNEQNLRNWIAKCCTDGPRNPYFEAEEELRALNRQGIQGGCAETSLVFLEGGDLAFNQGLIPGHPGIGLIRKANAAKDNLQRIVIPGDKYVDPRMIFSARDIKPIGDILYNPATLRVFIAMQIIERGPTTLDATGYLHTIAAIRCSTDPNEMPKELAHMMQGATLGYTPYWVYDTNNFMLNDQDSLVPTNTPYPRYLRLLGPNQLATLISGYANPTVASNYRENIKPVPIYLKAFGI